MAGCLRASSATCILVLFVVFGISYAAKDILVGGKVDAWKVPSSPSDSLNKWAERARFQVGDRLVWKYDGGKDSVLEVNKEDYGNCNTSNPIKKFNGGNTKVELDHPGPFYFISGAKGSCEQGEKLHVVVITPRGAPAPSQAHTHAPSPAPSPSSGFEDDHTPAPAVAPSSGGANALESGILMTLIGVFAMWVF
ncbi:early nodulin-like protein 13 [Arachis stenosperma]|uniref:early nodulin-like protein 13 n=1 Tax=Arachis stenosperma TaxID=217475 RepID=UPI0025ACFFD4|nr:early nodulin-like protein 13 [Arachis stenosperma]